MSVPPGEHLDAALDQPVGEGAGVRDRLALALAERLRRGDAERHRLRGDDVHERTALLAGED